MSYMIVLFRYKSKPLLSVTLWLCRVLVWLQPNTQKKGVLPHPFGYFLVP